MKRIIAAILAVFLLACLLAGCGDANEKYYGTYTVTEFMGFEGDDLNDRMGGEISLTLEKHGKGSIFVGNEINGITWQLDGSRISVAEDGFEDVMTGTLSDNVITLSLSDDIVMDFVRQ